MYFKDIVKRHRSNRLYWHLAKREQGAALLVSLMMLIVVLILSISMSTISLQGEKASRNDRDRQIALMAAEAALKDAEMDIDPQIVIAGSRADTFDPKSNLFFEAGCATGVGNTYQGMCLPATQGQTPVWFTVDLASDAAASASVQFGRFTGQTMVIGQSSFPAKLPRYIIEAVQDLEAGRKADEQTKYLFRITAIGFGANENTQVVLQSFYRKAEKS